MSTTNERSVVYIIYETNDSTAVIAAHRLFMALMLHGCTARMMQSQIADAEKRKDMIETALRTADTVVELAAEGEPGELMAEQQNAARELGKPIVKVTLPVNMETLLDQLGWQDHALTTDLPADLTWPAGAWRLKFFNESTMAHGYGMLKLLPDGSAQGDLNIAQGNASLSTKIAARWTLEDRQLTINGLQQVQGLPTRLEYKLEMYIEQRNGSDDSVIAFGVRTAQGDTGVLQRAPQ